MLHATSFASTKNLNPGVRINHLLFVRAAPKIHPGVGINRWPFARAQKIIPFWAEESIFVLSRASMDLNTSTSDHKEKQNYSCVSFDETGDGSPSFDQRWHVSTCPQRPPTRLQPCCCLQPLSFSHSPLSTSCLCCNAVRQVSDVIASTLHLCNVILDGILRKSIVRIVAHRHICNFLDSLNLADSSTLFEVDGYGKSSIPVSIVVLKFPKYTVSL